MTLSYIKQGDTAPSLQTTLSDNGAVVDLTAATAIRVIGVQNGVVLFARTVSGNSAGIVDMPWQVGDTAAHSPIKVKWRVTWPGGAIETFPAYGYDTVWVTENPGGAA